MASLAAAALSLVLLQSPAQYDTVVLWNGGVLRGTVIEDLPGADVVLQMPDGTVRKLPRVEVSQVYYAGTQVAPAEPPPPPPGPPPEPPSEPPPPAPPPDLNQVLPWQFALGLSAAFPLGTLDASGLRLSQAVTVQFAFTFEAAYRFILPLEVGLYLRLAGGSSQPALNQYCVLAGGWCDAYNLGFGPYARYSFLPQGKVNPWIAAGFGIEWLDISNKDNVASIDYTGWEVSGSAGADWRLSPSAGVGLFVTGRWGRFEALGVTGGLPITWPGSATHGWFETGVRFLYGL